MRSIRAIYIKQLLDIIKNRAGLIQTAVFPVLAFVFTELIAKPDESIPDTMFITMFSTIFSGMILMMMAAGCIAEDRERKSLRFLVMAGVKPYQYLLGSGGVILTIGIIVSLLFALIAGYSGAWFWAFFAMMTAGAAASIFLGAAIGIFAKNQSTATGIGMPIAMVLGFSPMISMFNDTAKKVFGIFYTMQLDTVVNNLNSDLAAPLLITVANVLVLLLLFIFAYKRKGLRA